MRIVIECGRRGILHWSSCLSLSLFCCCDYAVPMSRPRQVGSEGLMSCPAPLGRQN